MDTYEIDYAMRELLRSTTDLRKRVCELAKKLEESDRDAFAPAVELLGTAVDPLHEATHTIALAMGGAIESSIANEVFTPPTTES